jgi:sugar transferase (PEP-CTERM/EpsH1 system associated)
MRILILTPQLPYPPRQGTALRNWGIVSNLARQHDVWLLTFDERNSGEAIPPEIHAACRQVAAFPMPCRSTARRLSTLLTSALPDMAWRLWSPDFAAKYREWVTAQHFDIIQIEGIELARYALESTLRVPNLKSKIVFDDHNCEYLLQRRAFTTDLRQPKRWHAAAYSFVQWQRLRAFERRAALSADAVLSVSPQDAAALTRIAPSAHPHVIFNGIDVASYDESSVKRQTSTKSPIPHRPSPIPRSSTLVFTGKMDFRPNIDAMLWFGRKVFPLLKQSIPRAQLLIVGQRPSPRLDVLRADPHITLTGAVDDVRPYIAQADVYVAPLRVGGGTRLKLLEAMAMCRPIVSTSLGCEGFDIASGHELVIADTPADFAHAVARLLRDDAARNEMGLRARAFVTAHYDWSVIVPKLERVYKQVRGQNEG